MNNRLEIKKTADGSNTLFLKELKETYHSFHGAIQESIHVFIQQGLQQFTSLDEISVFELGFGTGLNALLASLWSGKNKIKIDYTTIEAFPVPIEICGKMNYCSFLEKESIHVYNKIINASWSQTIEISEFFSIHKVHKTIQDWSCNDSFDVIFYDAFGPRAQPEMWEIPVLEKMFESLNSNGVMVTYCAQGQFRRNLKSLGFMVDSLPGPPGKREMTRGTKI